MTEITMAQLWLAEMAAEDAQRNKKDEAEEGNNDCT